MCLARYSRYQDIFVSNLKSERKGEGSARRQLLAAEPALGARGSSNRRSWLEGACYCGRRQQVRSIRSRCAPQARLHRFEPAVPGVAPSPAARARSQLLELLCEASGLGVTALRSCMHSAAAPMAGTVFTTSGCATQGGRASAGRLGDRPNICGSPYVLAFDTRYAGACRVDAVPQRAAAATPA